MSLRRPAFRQERVSNVRRRCAASPAQSQAADRRGGRAIVRAQGLPRHLGHRHRGRGEHYRSGSLPPLPRKVGTAGAVIELEIDQREWVSGATELTTLLDGAARALLRPGRVDPLWQRSSSFVDPETRAKLTDRHLAAPQPLWSALARTRTDPTEAQADALTWAVQAVLPSARAFERAKLDREHGRQLLSLQSSRWPRFPACSPRRRRRCTRHLAG